MKKFLFIIPLVSVIIWSCRKDFVVENIDKKTVTVNAPANNGVTTINLVTFWWNELDGAEEYNLQIVSPNFSNAVQLLLDTNVITNKFNFSFKPGTYQWRIQARNAGHRTAYQTFDLKIDTTSNLSDQFVNLQSPAKGAVTSNTLVTFSWSSLTVAKKYRLQISSTTTTVLDTTLIGKTSFSYKLLATKNATTSYEWNVKAINDVSESQFNPTPYTVIVDLKGPSTPLLGYPASPSDVKDTTSLRWTRFGDTKYDSVYVGDDSLLTNVYLQVSVTEASILVSDLGLPLSAPGVYYWWRVRSFDPYGNPSLYSSRRKFRIIP